MRTRIAALAVMGLLATGAAAQSGLPFDVEVITDFDEPWAMTFLPDGRLLVTEKKGNLLIVAADGTKLPVRWTPDVDYGGQGGFGDDEGVYPEIWSIGHRNPLGIAFDLDGNLWNIEMGPAHGDELNFVTRGGNYGYPVVSDGDHYDGREIPDHDTRPEFDAPAIAWIPAISPGDLMVYGGDLFADWRGNAFAAGLGSQAIIRIELDGDRAREVERYDMGARIRSVVEGPDGAIWVLEDERRNSQGRLLKLTPGN